MANTEVDGENGDLLRQLRMLVRRNPLEPVFDHVNRNLKLQRDRGHVGAVLLLHLLAQESQSLPGDFRLPVGRVDLLLGGIRLTLGVSRVVHVDRGQHDHDQQIGHSGIRHDLVHAESEYLL